jgi:hypothetical protein
MRTIEFQNPVFKPGFLNYTVRLGEKWGDLEIGEKVHIGETGLVGEIQIVVRCRLKNIPSDVLRFEHDKECKNYFGLLDVLRDVYNIAKTNFEFGEEIVTCIGFMIFG